MINEKNMFTYTIRKMGMQKENNIVPNDPSNIFEFTNKKRKMINFDDLLGVVKKENIKKEFKDSKKESIKNSKKDNIKNSKKDNKKGSIKKEIKPINFNDNNRTEKINTNKKFEKINTNEKFENLNINEKFENLNINEKAEKINTKSKAEKINIKKADIEKEDKIEKPFSKEAVKIENISSILLSFCRENNDEYSNKLHDLLIKESSLFNNDPCEVEIREIEKKIEESDRELDKWIKMKNTVLDENVINVPNIVRREGNTEVIKEEEDDKLSKLVFLKDKMKSYLRNISERLNEIEQKIFNMTAHDNEMDPLILLKALTRYN
jgi:hypothetical protein